MNRFLSFYKKLSRLSRQFGPHPSGVAGPYATATSLSRALSDASISRDDSRLPGIRLVIRQMPFEQTQLLIDCLDQACPSGRQGHLRRQRENLILKVMGRMGTTATSLRTSENIHMQVSRIPITTTVWSTSGQDRFLCPVTLDHSVSQMDGSGCKPLCRLAMRRHDDSLATTLEIPELR
jgi:hypothetical protein